MRLFCYWQWISSKHCQSSLRIHSVIASWIHSYFDNVMMKFMINNRTHAWKTDVNLLKDSRHFLIQSEARSKSIVTRLRAFSRASCELCLHLLRVFLMIGQSGCVGLGFTTPIELPFHKPLFGIVLVNRHAPLLICSSGMNMIWSVYQLLRVANHNWNLANGLGCPCYTQLPLDCQIYDFLRGLNKNI